MAVTQRSQQATQRPPQQGDDVEAGLMDGQAPHQPDEDGPHDVPDDKVIEKTLPSAPVRDTQRSS